MKIIFKLHSFLLLPVFFLASCGNDSAQELSKQDVSLNKATVVSSNEADNSSKAAVFGVSNVGATQKGFATDFSWMNGNKSISFKDITKGKVVFLNFWGTWCPPCRKEIPDIVKLDKDLPDKDFVVVGIALERERNQQKAVQLVSKFADSKGLNYNIIVDDGKISKAYGPISAVPTTFIIDRDGRIVETMQGLRSYETFLSSIKKVL